MAPSLSIRFNCTDVISVYICLILFSFFDENCFKDLSTTDQFKSMGISKAKTSDADCAELWGVAIILPTLEPCKSKLFNQTIFIRDNVITVSCL